MVSVKKLMYKYVLCFYWLGVTWLNLVYHSTYFRSKLLLISRYFYFSFITMMSINLCTPQLIPRIICYIKWFWWSCNCYISFQLQMKQIYNRIQNINVNQIIQGSNKKIKCYSLDYIFLFLVLNPLFDTCFGALTSVTGFAMENLTLRVKILQLKANLNSKLEPETSG